jgi:hypothetical protein
MADKEVKDRAEKYRHITEYALKKISITAKTDKEKKIAEDFLGMCRNYLSDGQHFERNGNYVLALAAYSYAHAWLDAGVRAGFFDGKGDDRLFTLH